MNKKAFSLIELSIVILIIGILIAGVTQGSRLVRQFQLTNAKTLTQSSAVNSIKDLVLWLEPTMDNSITSATNANNPEDGDKISAWNDSNSQLSQKINVSQATSGNQPTYVSKGIGNLPTLSFGGAHFLDNTSSVPIPAGYKQYTIFAVWQTNSSSAVRLIVHQRGPLSCLGDRAGIFITSTNVNGWGCASGDVIASAYSVNTPYNAIYRVDSTQANNVTIYLNGSQTGPTAAALNNIGTSAFAVGYGDSSSAYYFSGYISEIIVFTRALKSSEISDIRAYLSKKYGFAA